MLQVVLFDSNRKILPFQFAIMPLMSVYVEVVFINNFFVDLVLLFSTSLVFACKTKQSRLCLSALVGALVATAYPLLPYGSRLAVKLLLAPIMVFVAFGTHKVTRSTAATFFKQLAVFVALTYLCGGLISGASYVLGIQITGYLILGEVFAAVLSVLVFAASFARRTSKVRCGIKDVEVTSNGVHKDVRALCDTANTLTDDVTGQPVLLLSERLASELHTEQEGFIGVVTASGKSELVLVRLEAVKVKGGYSRSNQLAAVSRGDFDGYDVVLNNAMFGR